MIHLAADEYLIREGETSTCGYLIEQGSLDVVVRRPEGERIIAVLGVGELVGEMALLDAAPRSASVRAREQCVLLPITSDSIGKRFAKCDPVLHLVMSTILDRFRNTMKEMRGESLLLPESHGRRAKRIASEASAELRLEKEFEVALFTEQVTVYYQPIVNLKDGRIVGFEALSRWIHPERGLIAPDVFVPISAVSGLSCQLVEMCLKNVMRDLPILRLAAATNPDRVQDPRISINISGLDLSSPTFAQHLARFTDTYRLALNHITLELTETAIVQDVNGAAEALRDARAMGFKIAIDDFGTGYSSLNYIRALPVDILKIDRSFIQGVCDCATTQSIVESVLALSKTLNLSVVAEGIETEEQLAVLRALDCELGQGYLFGRPLPLREAVALTKTWRQGEKQMPVISAASA